MLGRRRRRRANIDPTLVQCLVFAALTGPDSAVLVGPPFRRRPIFKPL